MDVLPAAQAADVGVLAFSILAGGMLTGAYDGTTEPAPGSRLSHRANYVRSYWEDRTFNIVERIKTFGQEIGPPRSWPWPGHWRSPRSRARSSAPNIPEEIGQLAAVLHDPLTEEEIHELHEILADADTPAPVS